MSTSALNVYDVVTDYSADKTGSTSASGPIQNAINAANSAGGGIVFIPVGTYKITDKLTIKSNVHVLGEGGGLGTGGVLLNVNHGGISHQACFERGGETVGWSIRNVRISFATCLDANGVATHAEDIGVSLPSGNPAWMFAIEDVDITDGYYGYYAAGGDFMGRLSRVRATCKNAFRQDTGTTMVFENCFATGRNDSSKDGEAWHFYSVYDFTLNSCAFDQFKNGTVFYADAARGMVVNALYFEGNDSNGGQIFNVTNSNIAWNGCRSVSNIIRCSNDARGYLVRLANCDCVFNGVSFGGNYGGAGYNPDTATGGNSGSEAITLSFEGTGNNAITVIGSHINTADASSFTGTRTPFNNSSTGTTRALIAGTIGISNQVVGDLEQKGQYFDHDYATDAERASRVLCGSYLRAKMYGSGNNSNHGGRIQLIDGGVIVGAIRIGTAGDPSYAVHLTSDSAGKPATSTWTVISDARTKMNLRPYAKGLDVLRQVELQTWEYNGVGDTPTGQTASGVVAQDLLRVLPDAVNGKKIRAFIGDTDEAQFLGVDYHLLFLSGLNAIKELDARVKELESTLGQ